MAKRRKAPLGADFREDPFEDNNSMPDVQEKKDPPAENSAPSPENTRRSGGNESNRVASVLLFAAGILIGLITLIEGTAGWKFMHKFLLGMFGAAVIFVPIILIYTSYLIGAEKSRENVTSRVIWGLGLTVLVSSTIQIFIVGEIPGEGLTGSIAAVFKSGVELKSGGVFSIPIAWVLLKLFGSMGAKIVIIIMVFVLLLLLTGKGVVEFMEMLLKPFKFAGQCIDGVHNVIMGGEFEEAFDEEEDSSDNGSEEDYSSMAERDFDADLEAIEIVNSKNSRPAEPTPEPRRELTREEEEFSRMFDIPLPGSGIVPAAEKKTYGMPEVGEESESAAEDDPDLDRLIDRAVRKSKQNRSEGKEENIDPEKSVQLPLYVLPGLDLLTPPKPKHKIAEETAEMREKADIIVNTLKSFGVEVKIMDIFRGPTITRYEIQPGAGVKVSKIRGLEDDIALNLAAESVRIEAPVPGKPVVGIEVPNSIKTDVTLYELLATPEYRNTDSKLTIAVGRDVTGKAMIGDITRMPHVIIAGTTGSGKSVCTRSIIMSILYKAKPDEVKFILIDPKVVEFRVFENIPHLLIPVVDDKKRAPGALLWAVNEMERRYRLFAEYRVNNIKPFNELTETNDELEFMPQIVVVIDELADLMMTAGKDVEDYICRLAQKGRAAGMHLIVATQRPDATVITGLIKANIPSRIALSVSSGTDSRIILDTNGAEKLLGNGDMLYMPIYLKKPVRIQGCYTSDDDVNAAVDFVRAQAPCCYDQEIMDVMDSYASQLKEGGERGSPSDSGAESGSDEDLVLRAAEVAVNAGQLSTTMLQKKLKLGYARASRIMDELEERGIIGPSEGSKPRRVLISRMQFDDLRMRMMGDED